MAESEYFDIGKIGKQTFEIVTKSFHVKGLSVSASRMKDRVAVEAVNFINSFFELSLLGVGAEKGEELETETELIGSLVVKTAHELFEAFEGLNREIKGSPLSSQFRGWHKIQAKKHPAVWSYGKFLLFSYLTVLGGIYSILKEFGGGSELHTYMVKRVKGNIDMFRRILIHHLTLFGSVRTVKPFITALESRADDLKKVYYLNQPMGRALRNLAIQMGKEVAGVQDYIVLEVAKGDGMRRVFWGALSKVPVVSKSFVLVGGTETFVDEPVPVRGVGKLVGDAGGEGVVDYTSGNWKVRFEIAPGDGDSVTLKYLVK